MHRLRSLLILLILVAALGCAASKPITDLRMITGEWSGTGTLRDGRSGPWDVVVKENGTYESHTPVGSSTGTLRLEDGKVRSKIDQTGRTGVFRLSEGQGGKPKLVYRSDDGAASGELERPGKK